MAKGVNIPLTISGLREAREDLAKLNDEFEKVKDDPIKSKKLAKEFNDLSKAVDDTTESLKEMNTAGELAGTKFDDLNEVLFQTNEEVLPLTSQIGEMEDRMYQLAAAGETSSKEFITLQGEVVKARKTIRDTDRQIDLLAENKGLSVFAQGWSQVGESLLRLDFEQASLDAKGLDNAVGNLGKMGASALKNLGSAVGTLSKTFLKFGATLLLNPIFLIAAVIAAVVAGIVLLLDKLGFLQPILDAVGKAFDILIAPIKLLIQAFKDFTDWLGITNFAEEELAEQRQKRAEKNLKNIDVQSAKEQADFDRKIALANAEGKSTLELEKQKQEAIIETARQRLKETEILWKSLEIQGKLTDEKAKEINALRTEANKQILDASNAIKVAEINNAKEVKEKEAEALKDRQEKYKEYTENRKSAARLVQDLELELMAEGTEKELAAINLKYDRLIEDTKANEDMLQSEKEKVIKNYESLRALEEKKINDKILEDKEKQKQKDDDFLKAAQQAQLDIIEGFQEEAYQLLLTDQEREEEALRTKYENQLSLARQFGQDTTQIEEAYAKEKAEMEDKYRKEKLEKDQAVEDAKLDLASSGLSAISQLTELFAGKNEKAAKAAKRAFQVQKAVSIAQAVIDTYKGANAIFASAAANPQSILFPAQPFITAGIAIASGIANVAKIAQTQFEGTSTPSASSPSAPSLGGGGGTSASASTPSFELFGQPNEDNNVSAAQAQELTPTVVKAVVVESDITTTQNKISKMKENAEL
jgi:hypothetical protein